MSDNLQLHPNVIVKRDVMIKARDGIRLATDLYLPADVNNTNPNRYPVLLHRTPYNKYEVESTLGYARWFTRRGYVSIIQDCRGTFGSEGEVNFLIPEAEDGFDTLKWIEQQPWSNGKVGTWGTSWAGWAQTAMAALSPKSLKTMVPNMSGSEAFTSSVRHAGALELRFLAWAFWHSATNTQAKLKTEPHIDAALNFGAPSFGDWLKRLPIRRGQTQLKLVPSYEDWVFKIMTETDYTDYWRHPSLAPVLHHDKFPDIPILLVGGWYDSYTRGTFENFQGLSANREGPVRLIVGPWIHGSVTPEQTYSGDVEFGDAAALNDFRELHLHWFDRTLKGVETKIDDDPPVRIFVMGGGGGYRSSNGRIFHGGNWRDEQEWPLERTNWTNFYVSNNGMLSTEPPTICESSTSYAFDPNSPVPSIGGNVSSLTELDSMPPGLTDPGLVSRTTRAVDLMSPGGFDQVESPQFLGCRPPYLPLGSRSDVLVFETEPLESSLEITGPIEVRLWVSSDAPDTDFTAKLVDVYPPSKWYPNGYALNITDSIVRMRYRNGRETAGFLNPGSIEEITITLYPTSNLFAVYHRVRLDISSSNFPRFDVNPNTGEPIGLNRQQKTAVNTVFHDIDHPSHIVLPVINPVE